MTAVPDIAPGARDLVGDVQRFGLFSAASVVARYTEMVDRAIAPEPMAPEERGPDDGGALTDGVVRVTEAWLRLLETAALQFQDDAARPAPTQSLVLPSAAAGLRSEASLWVHNTSSSPAAVDLHVTDLVAPTGRRIPSDAVSLVPQQVARLEPGTSREVRLRVDVPETQPGAEYHGVVVSSAAPGEPMTLRLVVRAPGAPGR